MARLGDLVVTIGAKTASFDKALGKSMRNLQNFGRSTQRLGQQISMRVTAPLAIMGATSVRAFQIQAKAIAQVEAGLRSTGGQVGYTSQQLQKMASDLQKTTLFGDEQILKDATAQLLTFTNISGEQFQRTQKAALDLATRLDGDLKGASIQLGKALNDPVANLSALSRSGIQFSEEQKAVIKSLAESGQLAEAQTIILDELNRQYGGSAEAAAKADGGITQLANAFGDLQEVIGQTLMPMITPLINKLREIIERMQGASEHTKRMAVVIGLVASAIGPALFVTAQLARGFHGVTLALKALSGSMLATPWGIAAIAIGSVALAAYSVVKASNEATEAQKRMRAANKKATESYSKEAGKVEALALMYKQAGDDLERKKKITEQLQTIAPDYFKDLDAEKTSYDELAKSVGRYRTGLRAAAIQKAFGEELSDIEARRVKIAEDLFQAQQKLAQAEIRLADARKAKEEGGLLDFAAGAEVDNALAAYGRAQGEVKSLNQEQSDLAEASAEVGAAMERANDNLEMFNRTGGATTTSGLLEYLDKIEGKGKAKKKKKPGIDNESPVGWLEEYQKLMREGILDQVEVEPIQFPDTIEGLQNIPDAVDDFESDFTVDEVAFEKFQRIEERAKMFKNMMSGLMTGLQPVAEQFGNSMGHAFGQMAKGAQDGEEAMRNAARGMINQALAVAQASIIEAMISSGKFSGPAAPVVIPALVAGGIGLVQGLFNDIPAFAAGGIVSGPTLGLMGEYSGAAANPEVIAPLDKLQSMMGGQQVQVYGSIDGNSIRLANDRTNRNAKRFLR